jgi:hypothetical protein
MTEYICNAAAISWAYSGGTVTLSGDWRSFNFNPSQDKFDSTAGTHTSKTYIRGLIDFTCDLVGLAHGGTSGTAVLAAFAMGTDGTLTVHPQGTATGNQKFVLPCFTTGDPVTKFQYAGLTEIGLSFQGNGTYSNTVN